MTSKVSKASANVSENNIRGWHQKLTVYFIENNFMKILQEHPELIYNGDESGFQLVSDIRNKVLARIGSRYVLEVASGKEKVSVTAMYTICNSANLLLQI